MHNERWTWRVYVSCMIVWNVWDFAATLHSIVFSMIGEFQNTLKSSVYIIIIDEPIKANSNLSCTISFDQFKVDLLLHKKLNQLKIFEMYVVYIVKPILRVQRVISSIFIIYGQFIVNWLQTNRYLLTRNVYNIFILYEAL